MTYMSSDMGHDSEHKPQDQDQEQVQPWDKMDDEPSRAFEFFKEFRDMGMSRSLPKLAEKVGMSLQQMQTYSARYSWYMRAGMWDREQDRIDQMWMQEERKKAKLRHVRQAQSLQSKWLQRLHSLNPDELSPAEVIRYADIATKLEREALDIDNRKVEVEVSGSLETAISAMSPEDTRRRLQELNAEIEARLREQDAERKAREAVEIDDDDLDED